MADPRLTQSPRSQRSSTNDPEQYAKGEVETSQRTPSTKPDPGWEYLGKYPEGREQLYDVDRSH